MEGARRLEGAIKRGRNRPRADFYSSVHTGCFIIFRMATYVVERDDYAGWSTGRSFGLFGLAGGAVALVGWAVLHGHLGGKPTLISDQFFLTAMEWIGCGLFAIMALVTFGSLLLSAKARGTVVVTDMGVERQIDGRSRMLAWPGIEGFVVSPMGGVTLVEREGSARIEIPRYLDDYRACIAEIKARGVRSLPSERLKKKLTWRQHLLVFAATMAWGYARDAGLSHRVRGLALSLNLAVGIWFLNDEERNGLQSNSSRRLSWAAFLGMLGWLLYHMAHTW